MLGGSKINLTTRRDILFSSGVFGTLTFHGKVQAKDVKMNKEVANENSPLIQKLLVKSTELKEQRRQERLQQYYKRNFVDYFEFELGTRGLGKGETREKIDAWLKTNKD
eukprot:TRINITY_DN46851_c0_g4_i2.p3 TRINITY_DN46851_c0_g4~~TRINITY_DN46851_c0_g4_i2.p3  ORF type:complete len:109 (-),score=9.98 TRINITY_DN46851_c0_g4_i2:302-628(-)